jgi:hypothetical protein
MCDTVRNSQNHQPTTRLVKDIAPPRPRSLRELPDMKKSPDAEAPGLFWTAAT